MIKHYRFIAMVLMLFGCISMSFAQQEKPFWIIERPSGLLDYIGISSVQKDVPDYRVKARKQALAELVSQIEVTVSVNSLLKLSESEDSEVKSSYEEAVKSATTKNVSNLQMMGEWEDENSYWVYYRLDREEYAEQEAERKKIAIQRGFEFWYSGTVAMQTGDIFTAIDAYLQGLQTIMPFANDDLSCEYEGKTYSLSTLLYTSMHTVFDGISLTSDVQTINVEPFANKSYPIHLTLTKDGVPLRNMPINGNFTQGSGQMTDIALTNAEGITSCQVKNVVSKDVCQTIRFALDLKSLKSSINAEAVGLIDKLYKRVPECLVNIECAADRTLSAYIDSQQLGNEGVIRAVRAFINNKYFNLVDVPGLADVILQVTSSFEAGELVPGDMYQMQEYFTTININVLDNRRNQCLTTYKLEKKRTLVPAKSSKNAARNAAIRDAMKVVRRQLPDYIENLNIKTDGDIPQREYVPVEKPVSEDPEPVKPVEAPVVKPNVQPVVIPIIVRVPVPTAPVVDKRPVPERIEKPTIPQQPISQPTVLNSQEEEWIPGIFVRFVGKKDMQKKTFLVFSVVNRNDDDYVLGLYRSNQIGVNGNGEEVVPISLKLGSNSDGYYVSSYIVPEVPTKLEIEIARTSKVSMFKLQNQQGDVVKLRNLY